MPEPRNDAPPPTGESAEPLPSHDQGEAMQQGEEAQQIVPFDEFLIDEAGMETFPASDPPSWTPLITMGHPHQRLAPAQPVPSPDETPPASTQTKSSD